MGSPLAVDGFARAGWHGRASAVGAEPHVEFLREVLTGKPDITLEAIAKRLLAERSVKADTSMLSRFFRRDGITFKKRLWSPASKIGRTSAATGRGGANTKA
jgi:transposase